MKRIGMPAVCLACVTQGSAQDATAIVKRANDLMRGTSSFSAFTMTIVKPEWSRSFSMKAWSIEPDYALVYVTEPARDRGTVTSVPGRT